VSTGYVRAVAYSAAEKEPPSLGEVINKAAKRALGGGVPGMVAMFIQVRLIQLHTRHQLFMRDIGCARLAAC
jgi:hypothetical protein